MFHVLEHVRNPVEYVEVVSALLKPGGLLVIRVPNFNSAVFSLLGGHWSQLGLPAHLYFFSLDTLCALLEKKGFFVAHRQSISCPSVNEVSELCRGTLKLLGLKKVLSRRSRSKDGEGVSGKGRLVPILRRMLNILTQPLFYMTYPIWTILEKRGKASELFIVARKIKGQAFLFRGGNL
jgi:hypothetical protein